MSTRALSLVVRLLTTACAGAALGTMSGCQLYCPDSPFSVESFSLGTTADILALGRGSEYDAVVAVGAGGIVVHHDGTDDGAVVSNPVNVDLRGVVAFGSTTLVVGDGGTIVESNDATQVWTPRSSGITDDLLGVVRGTFETGNFVVAISAGQIVVSVDDGATWAVVQPPAEGWGVLRAVFTTDTEIWVIGDAGVAWASSNPAGAWARQDLGAAIAGASLIGGGRVSGDDESDYTSMIAVVSSSALWFRTSTGSEWTAADVSFDGAIVAYAGGYILTDTGSIYDVDEGGGVALVTQVDFEARAIMGNWLGFYVAGTGGEAVRANPQYCVGFGRPWVVGGEVVTAELAGEILADDPVGHELALAWARDGLMEHASVASFARVVAELLSIGAPAELVRATQQAIADELEHARLCFDLASKHAGAVLGPGSLPVLANPANFGTVSDSRAGKPVAIALAMLEEGCINESVAAAEAAVAASQCRDKQAKSVLSRIAADETRHAALAWRTLRWLLDTHPEVAPALRTRFHQLASPMPRTTHLAAGRLSSHDRAAIHLRVFAEMIAPLAAQLVLVTGARPNGAMVVTSGPTLA